MFTEITPNSHYKDRTFLCTLPNRPYLRENRTKYANHSVGVKIWYIAVFLNCRAAARYRALASIIPGRETFSPNLSF